VSHLGIGPSFKFHISNLPFSLGSVGRGCALRFIPAWFTRLWRGKPARTLKEIANLKLQISDGTANRIYQVQNP
jgi:hypothetical protein